MLLIVINCYYLQKSCILIAKNYVNIHNRWGNCMLEKLKIKAIYDDLIKNVLLTDEQIKILNMVLNKDSIVKISMEIGVSERTIGYEIKKIKKLFTDYYNLQLCKALMLMK